MLPTPMQGIGALKLPLLPPTPSGPNPTEPGSFNAMYDGIKTKADQAPLPQLPTQMEIRPLMSPASSLDEPFVDQMSSVEFPNAVGADGLLQPGQKVKPTSKVTPSPFTFLEPLSGLVKDVSTLDAQASKLAGEAAVGGDVDLHDVMIASEKAGVALQLTTQIRNRMVDAYQEVMRMQV